jgi:hypothetical protein
VGRNSHNYAIDESQKPFQRKVTAQEFDLKVLAPVEFRKKWKLSERERKELLATLER